MNLKVVPPELQPALSALSTAGDSLKKGWPWLLFPLLYFVTLSIVANIAGIFGGLAGGFILGIVQGLIIAHYLLGVRAGVKRERVLKEEHLSGMWELFIVLINSLFILFIVSFLVSMLFGSNPELHWVKAAVTLSIFLVCNPILEIATFRGDSGMDAIRSSFEFVRDNFLQWFLPQVVLLSPVILFFGSRIIHPFASGSISNLPEIIVGLIASTVLGSGIPVWLSVIVSSVATYLFFAFRGALFLELSTGSRRQREFRAKMGL